MGGSQSQESERAVNVEHTVSEDGSLKVMATEDFSKFLLEKVTGGRGGEGESEEEPVEEDDPLPTNMDAESIMSPLRDDHGRGSGRDYSEGESNRWRKKYEMEKVKNEMLKNITSEEFDRTINEVKEKLASQVPQLVPSCEDCKEKVLLCYLSNPGRPLNCHSEVKEYVECVKKVRRGELDKTQTQEQTQAPT